MSPISLESDAELIGERNYISYQGPIEFGALRVRLETISYTHRREMTFKFMTSVHREIRYDRKQFHRTRNLRIHVAEDNTKCDYYVEKESIVILFREPITKFTIKTLIFEWDFVEKVKIIRWWRLFFLFEIYQTDLEFKGFPEGTEVYIGHPTVAFLYKQIGRRFIPGLEWESSKVIDVALPYNTGNEIVWRSKLPNLGENGKAVLSIKYGPNPEICNWMTLGAVFGLVAFFLASYLIVSVPPNDADLLNKAGTIGTIVGAGFGILLAVRTWFYANEIRISGLSFMKYFYTVLAALLILLPVGYYVFIFVWKLVLPTFGIS